LEVVTDVRTYCVRPLRYDVIQRDVISLGHRNVLNGSSGLLNSNFVSYVIVW